MDDKITTSGYKASSFPDTVDCGLYSSYNTLPVSSYVVLFPSTKVLTQLSTTTVLDYNYYSGPLHYRHTKRHEIIGPLRLLFQMMLQSGLNYFPRPFPGRKERSSQCSYTSLFTVIINTLMGNGMNEVWAIDPRTQRLLC